MDRMDWKFEECSTLLLSAFRDNNIISSREVPWNRAILISRAISIITYTNFVTAIAQRTKIVKLNHLYLYGIQTDHI